MARREKAVLLTGAENERIYLLLSSRSRLTRIAKATTSRR
jgi:hypothetical protein